MRGLAGAIFPRGRTFLCKETRPGAFHGHEGALE